MIGNKSTHRAHQWASNAGVETRVFRSVLRDLLGVETRSSSANVTLTVAQSHAVRAACERRVAA